MAALRPMIGLLNVRRLSTSGISELPFSVGKATDRINKNLSEQMGISLPSIRFVQSTLVLVPTVVGFFKPIVLLPVSALSGLTPRQLEMILAHEIAHIHRRDFLVNVAQTIVETILFYHPAVWLVSNAIRIERENCCDDMAVSAFGDAPAFARALLRLEQTSQIRPPALAANSGSLVKRVSRLIENPSTKKQSSAIGVCLTLMLIESLKCALPVMDKRFSKTKSIKSC